MNPGRPLRVIIAHCAYQLRGGEDFVAEAERDLLHSQGHEVLLYQRKNDEIKQLSKLSVASQTLWSRQSYAQISSLIFQFKADLLHVHNTFPLISPSLYWAAQRRRVPVIQTLHNFRLLCPQAMFLRDNAPCESCLGRLPWRGVVHRCYRASALQTSVLAGMLAVHRGLGTYRRKVTRYIALNEFSRRKFIEGGLPADRIVIKPNFVNIPAAAERVRQKALFVGRLSPEKGIFVLLEALRRQPRVGLDVIGTGPLAPAVARHPQITAKGWQEPQAVHEHMRRAAYLVFPSRSEPFGLVAIEAFACGLPVIASRLRPISDLIQEGHTGLLFEPGSASDLADKMAWAEAHPEAMRRMGAEARRVYEARFTPQENYRQLLAIYEDAMEVTRQEHAKWAMQG